MNYHLGRMSITIIPESDYLDAKNMISLKNKRRMSASIIHDRSRIVNTDRKLMAFAAKSLLHSAVSGSGSGKYRLSFSCSVKSNLWIRG